jgi:hypothetical protein
MEVMRVASPAIWRTPVRIPARALVRLGASLIALAALSLLIAGAASAAAPELTMVGPTEVNAESATLRAEIAPDGAPITLCEFEYGVHYEFAEAAPCSPAPGGATTAVSAKVQSLEKDTAYFYRLVVIAEVEPEAFEVFRSQTSELLFTPPTVVGAALASKITSFATTLSGVVGSGELTPSYHFEYGTTSAYGSSAPAPDAETAIGGGQTVSQTIAGLQPNTLYHFALVVTNFGGHTSVGPDETFTTRPLVPPQVASGAAQAVGQVNATLTGTVNPEGLDTTYYFEYGTSTGYGAVWPNVPAHAGGGNAGQAVAVAIENLQPGTTYHYRLVASNEDGTTAGADETFTTAEHLISVIQPVPLQAPSHALLAAVKESRRIVTVGAARHAKKTRRRPSRKHSKKRKRKA